MTNFLSSTLDPGWQTGVRLEKICACHGHGLTGLGRREVSNRIGGGMCISMQVRWVYTFF